MQQNTGQAPGASLRAGELLRFLDHLVQVNLRAEAAGRRKTPLCIWGRHGIGKTEIVRDYAREKGYAFTSIAPAQFEEMGDLLGMPQIAELGGRVVTAFRPPEWVPAASGPGILLIDDVNRADDRILRGLMQLLQDYRLVSWSLPQQWQIVLTANPGGGAYSVTPMDDSLLTRMQHVNLEFDLGAWIAWADRHGIDKRGINFLLAFPGAVTGRRTTPRTLVQFFESIAGIDELEADPLLLQALGEACLDEETAATFVAFVRQGLHALPGPAELLAAGNFQREIAAPLERAVRRDVLRVDILAGFCRRLAAHLQQPGRAPAPEQLVNLKAFLLLDWLPNDLRLGLAQDLAAAGDTGLQQLVEDPEVGRLLLGE